MRSDDRSGGRPFVVELAGTPGCGKTTLCGELVRVLGQGGLRAATIVQAARPRAAHTSLGAAVARVARGHVRDAALWQVFYAAGTWESARFAAEHRELARLVARGQRVRPISPAMKRHTLYWFAQLGGRYRLLTRGPAVCDVLVLDDGFLHRAVALHASHLEEPDAAAVGRYVDLIPEPDLAIRPVADLETCLRRVRERGIWRHSRSLGPEEIARSLRSAEGAIDLAVDRGRDLGWRVLEVSNEDGDLELVRERLRQDVLPAIDAASLEGVGEP